MSHLNDLILRMMDAAFGWLLALPHTVSLIVLSVFTAAILLMIRRLTTDQEHLTRCVQDQKRLKLLSRIARRHHDKDALQRYRATSATIGALKARSEIRPLLMSLLPVALLATWASQRIAYLPIRAGQDVLVTMYLPAIAEGRLTHLVPLHGVECPSGWIQQATRVQQAEQIYCRAQWTLRAQASDQPYDLTFRYAGTTYHKTLRVGQTTYEPPIQTFGNANLPAIETRLDECRLFGAVGGVKWIGLPPWLVAYFLVSIPAMLLLKWAFRIR